MGGGELREGLEPDGRMSALVEFRSMSTGSPGTSCSHSGGHGLSKTDALCPPSALPTDVQPPMTIGMRIITSGSDDV